MEDAVEVRPECSTDLSNLTIDIPFVSSTFALTLVNMLIVFGNGLVIAAVVSQRSLHSTTNFMITSLALSDFSIGVFVLPFSVWKEVTKIWKFGHIWCQIWLAIDVWLCTASIYNLVVVSFDRFMAVTHPIKYKLVFSAKVGKIMIALAWTISLLISFPPILIWSIVSAFSGPDTTSNHTVKSGLESLNSTGNLTEACDCSPMNNHPSYIIYSAMGSFIIPLLLLVTFNIGIYKAVLTASGGAVRSGETEKKVKTKGEVKALRVHRGGNSDIKSDALSDGDRSKNSTQHPPLDGTQRSITVDFTRSPKGSHHELVIRRDRMPLLRTGRGDKASTTSLIIGSRFRAKQKRQRYSLKNTAASSSETFFRDPPSPVWSKEKSSRSFGFPTSTRDRESSLGGGGTSSDRRDLPASRKKSQATSGARAEQKVAKTIGIVVGCYVLCWMPFAIIYLLQAGICELEAGCMPRTASLVFFWLGYCNSALNPIIYALFSRDFRRAFKRVLFKLFRTQFGKSPGMLTLAARANRNMDVPLTWNNP